jgi:hypothetical protein
VPVAAGVGGHDDDRIGKGDHPAVGIGDLALVEDLKQDIHDVRMRLFDLVEQDHGIRLAAHFFGELAGLVVADVSRR